MDSSEIILGIDLGTSYSTAAAVIGNEVYFALDARGEATFPSVVHFPAKGPPVVGHDAEKFRATDPQNTLYGIKRIVGRPFDSPAVRLLDHSATFRLKAAGKGEPVISTQAGDHSASEVASIILRHLRERAEARFKKKITKAVLTVPVTAPTQVHDAMVRCGRMAGLEVLKVLTEPCAGAISRGRVATSGAPLLVYDFGGGTFDAAIVQQVSGKLRVLASSGDECLGGDDFDALFARFVGDKLEGTFHKDFTRDAVIWDRIQRTCERVKRALSTSAEAKFSVKDLFRLGGVEQHLEAVIRREQLTPVWAELVERSILCAQESLTQAQLSPEQLGLVLLIGGTSYLPQVRAAVPRAFGPQCVLETDPQTAVARGAALVAAHPEILIA